MIPELMAESFGAAAIAPLALAGVLTIVLLFVHSVGELFDDPNS